MEKQPSQDPERPRARAVLPEATDAHGGPPGKNGGLSGKARNDDANVEATALEGGGRRLATKLTIVAVLLVGLIALGLWGRPLFGTARNEEARETQAHAGEEKAGTSADPQRRGQSDGTTAREQDLSPARGPKAAGGSGKPGEGGRAVPVLLAPVVRQDVPVYLDGLGTVAAYKTVTVRTQVDGRLERVAFEEGQAVKKGTLLAQIDARPFAIQLQQAEGAKARDTAQLVAGQLNLARYEAVAKDKLIPQQQVDDQRAVVGQLEGALKTDEAQVAQAKLMLDYARITSPIDGVTGVRLVDPGNVVHPGDASGLVVVTQLDPIAVLFTLPEDDLPRVTAAMAHGKLEVEAQGREGATAPAPTGATGSGAATPGPLARGVLALIDNQINASTATIRLKAIFSNPEHTLWPNQFVKARLHLGVKKQALVVPAVAVQRGPKGAFVYVVGPDDTARMKPVEVDELRDDVAVLAKGVDEGEKVVVEGQYQLRPGAPVALRAATQGPGTPGGARPSSGPGTGAPAGRKRGGP